MRFGKHTGAPGQRLRAPAQEQDAPRVTAAPSAAGAGSTITDRVPETEIDFLDTGGHDHSGAAGGGTPVDHGDLTGVGADDHHAQDHQARHQSGGADALTGAVDANGRVGVRKNSTGTAVKRRTLNLIEGANVTLTVSEDAGNEEVDITIAAAAAGATDRVFVGAWHHANAGNVNTASFEQLASSLSISSVMGEAAPYTGNLTLFAVTFSGAHGADASNYLDFEVYINGVASGMTGRVNDVLTEWVFTGSEAVTAADLVTVYAKRTGTLNAVSPVVKLYMVPS